MKYHCDNCSFETDNEDGLKSLCQIDNLADRLDPGGIVPHGECPECGAFVYQTMSIQREFPSYDDMKGFADLLAKLPGFTDSSWHNDTCPSMEHEESKTKIWVEYADPGKRENPGPRFSVERGESGDADCVLETDHEVFVIETVGELLRASHLKPETCGASQLACNIVNNTFLSLDGFAAMRKQMEGTEYTAEHFGAELARIVDRELPHDKIKFSDTVIEILTNTPEWDSDTNQAIADAAIDLLDVDFAEDPDTDMRHITVYMSDGDTISTNINGTDEEIMRHYLGTRFEAGCDTKHHVALAVHFHDTDKTYGLPIKAIEMGTTHRVKTVRRVTVCVDETKTIEEFMITTQGGAEFALDDVWVYNLNGEWIKGIGYKHATAETMYVANNSEHGYLVLDKDFGWRYTQDKTKATKNIKSEWDDIARQLTHRFKLIAI